jgi:ABC-type sugar transport system substrate-binding protein
MKALQLFKRCRRICFAAAAAALLAAAAAALLAAAAAAVRDRSSPPNILFNNAETRFRERMLYAGP